MSLKAFHIVFIAAAIVLALGLGIWSIQQYAQEHQLSQLILGVTSLIAGIALIIYGKAVLRKLKGMDLI